MTKRHRTKVGTIALFALSTLAASASATSVKSGSEPRAFIELMRLTSGLALEQYIANSLAELRQLDKNADGLVVAEIEAAEILAQAQERASNLQRLYGFDLNDDGKVERAEVERVTESRDGFVRDRRIATDIVRIQVAEIMKADRNGDGVIDFAEARASKQSNGKDHRTDRARQLLKLDPDRDGRLTAKELETLARNAFAVVDADGNSLISLGEYEDFSKVARKAVAARESSERNRCVMSKPASAHRFILVGSNEGAALSTVSVSGQDAVTTVSQLNIEPGADQLEILLITATPRIWKFEGAVDRVARVFVAASKAAGVVGLARERTEFLAARDCMLLTSPPDEVALAIARGALRRAVGREPDAILGQYKIGQISLPSGTIARKSIKRPSTEISGIAPVWGALMMYRPEGVVQLDAKFVIASHPAEPYSVLPEHAGLLQLLREGVLVYLSGGRAGPMKFKIAKPMKRFPSGLSGSHSVTYLLATGVPMPPGDAGHSCVISEETGLASNDAFLCRH
jgi:EF hand